MTRGPATPAHNSAGRNSQSRGRAAVIGGSVAGCAAAIALARSGYAVSVFERSRGGLRGRGAGIAVPAALREQLLASGYLGSTLPFLTVAHRRWVVRDGAGDIRLLWEQPSPGVTLDWAALWQALRDRVPDTAYRAGVLCTGVRHDADAVTVSFEDGGEDRFDVLVGADGHSSLVRRLMHAAGSGVVAGYVAWRGVCRLADLDGLAVARLLENSWVTACYPRGHTVYYRIPGADGGTGPADIRVNWVAYAHEPVMPAAPPGAVPRKVWEQLLSTLAVYLPDALHQVIARTAREAVSVQTVRDVTVPAYAHGRVALAGDAATLARPHASSGVLKALRDAMALENVLSRTSSIIEALDAYGTARTDDGNATVALGALLGRHQVEHTPNWAEMTGPGLDRWTKGILAGTQHYLYGNVAAATRTATGAAPAAASEGTRG
ncbi:FAD-dependent monooxygenase [Streptomyces sp. NPDC020799]|uniref:FAD binding domain-containing protein n=1 Tax=Streptomyces sp. NPDC020799 TaxID=3365091 RepID=UPI0037891AA2